MKKALVTTVFLFIMILASSAVTEEKELFAEAESRYFTHNYSLALEAYNEFLRLYPLSELTPDVQYRRALCLFRLKRFDESLVLFQKVETRYRATRYLGYVNFWKGMIYYYKKDFPNSISAFNEFLVTAADPDLTAQALYYKAVADVSLKNYSAAASSSQRLITDYPSSSLYTHGIVLLAFVYLKQSRFTEIIELSEKAETQAPPQELKEKLLFYKAAALWGLEEYKEAILLYNQLLEGSAEIAAVAFAKLFLIAQSKNDLNEMERLLNLAEERFSGKPDFLVDFWTNIGIVCYTRDNFDLAEHYLSKAWNLRQNVTIRESVPLYLTEIMLKKNNKERALSILEEYISLFSDSSGSLLFRLGDLNLLTKNYRQARHYYSLFIEQFPESKRLVEAQYFLIYSYYKSGDLKLAYTLSQEVIDNFQGENFYREHLKLYITLLKENGETDKAYQQITHYLKFYPDDLSAHLDLLKILFAQQRYREIIQATATLFKAYPFLKRDDPYIFLFVTYLEGLAFISQKAYTQAHTSLSQITEQAAANMGLESIIPYVLFYKGWALYRLDNFNQAAQAFSNFVKTYPGHELFGEALYLAGWCYYSKGDYTKAVEYLQVLAKKSEYRQYLVKSQFLMAKSLLSLNRSYEASQVFLSIYMTWPQSAFADDALFEYANILAAQGNIEEAVSSLLTLYRTYPRSPLAEEALYKRGEIYFQHKNYQKARDAFYEYRLYFTAGQMADASLYWGGLAAFNLGEQFGAVLLWEIIINDYRQSPFRSEAIKMTAEVYASSGDYTKALNLYTELIAAYPEEASAVNASQRAEELRYLILGLGQREAELTTIIDRQGGVASYEGRMAMIELARLYLNEEKSQKMDIAYSLIIQIIEANADSQSTSQAQFLLGEYYYKKQDYVKAGNEFLKAALINPQDRDFMAMAIYRAAEMMKQAGDIQTVRELVNRLEKNFPASQWAIEGRKLLQ